MKKSLFKKLTIGIFLFLAFVLLVDTFGKVNVHADSQHKHEFSDDTATYLPWNSSNTLPGTQGFYYLTKDVVLNETWHSTEFLPIRLCLNGHSIKLADNVNGNVIKVENGSTLYIIECSTQEHKYKIDENGLGIVDDSLTENYQTFKGGYITGGHGVETGGGIYVENGSIYLRRVNIIGNSTTGNGGALNISSSNPNSILLENTSFIGNVADGAAGGIYTGKNNQRIQLEGNCRISNNTSANAPAGILVENQLNLGADDVTSDIYIYDNKLKDNTVSDMSVTNKESVVRGKFTDTSKIGFEQIKNGIFKDFYKYNNPDKVNDMLVSHMGIPLGKSGNDAVYMYNAKDYSVTYDEEPHTFVPDSTFPVEYTIKYGTENGKYDLDTAPSFTDIGEHTIYYAVTVQSETIKGSQKITIADYDPAIKDYVPKPNKNLAYTSDVQELLTLPEKSGATYQYRLSDGYWSEYTPKAIEIGDYSIQVRVNVTDSNVYGEFKMKASIVANDKTNLQTEIETTTTYYDSISEKYKPIAETVESVLSQAKDLNNKEDATVSEINDMISDLQQSVDDAKAYILIVESVIESIERIGDVTLDKKKLIDNAREEYDVLPEEFKGLVTNYLTLVVAEMTYKSLSLLNDRVNEVIDAINAIGDVTYDNATKARINDARTKYNLLIDQLKTRVTNIATLEEKEAEYAKFEADHAAAGKVIESINNIGDVIFDDESKTKLEEVRAQYDALTEEQKPLVTNYQTLVDGEALYAAMQADDDSANNVESLIDAIGVVSYTEESKGKIDAARNAYDALTDGQKELVLNYSTLTIKEGQYKNLEDDNNAAKNVENLINAIGDVTYSKECFDKIETATNAYKTLSSARKILVKNVATLTSAESLYKDLEKTCKAIEAIDYVEYTVESKEKINAASALYDELSEENKAKVTNYDTLKAAEDKYNSLSSAHASKVIWLIVIIASIILVVALVIAYVLMFFVFNKYVIIKSKRRRVFKIGNKNNKIRLLKMNFRIIYRDEVDVYNKNH